MGWNGSNLNLEETKRNVIQDRTTLHWTFLGHLFLAICLVVSLVILAIFIFGGKSTRNKEDINPVKAGLYTQIKNTRHTLIAQKDSIKTSQFAKPVITNSQIFLDQKVKGKIVEWKLHEKPIFDNAFENYIASVLAAIPGERFLDIDLGEEFDAAFESSLTNSIVISSNDSDEVAAVKKAVIAAKEQIRQACCEGRSAHDVVTEARNEMNKIADYRDQLQGQLDKYILEGDKPEEVLSFAKEANELLKEYGAQPLEAPDDVDSAYDALISAKQGAIEEIDFLKAKDTPSNKSLTQESK